MSSESENPFGIAKIVVNPDLVFTPEEPQIVTDIVAIHPETGRAILANLSDLLSEEFLMVDISGKHTPIPLEGGQEVIDIIREQQFNDFERSDEDRTSFTSRAEAIAEIEKHFKMQKEGKTP